MPAQRNPNRGLQAIERGRVQHFTPNAEKLEVLRLVSEQVAIPLDQLARFLSIECDQTALVVESLLEADCVRRRAFIATDSPWVWLTARGAQLSQTGFPPTRDLTVRLLTHRRAINEVRLYVEARAPEGRWHCERAVGRVLDPNDCLPDAVFEIGAERHAIEVELSRKSRPALRTVLASHSNRYDAVVYFCGPQTRGLLEEARKHGAHPKLVVRDVPGMDQILATWSRGFGQRLYDARAQPRPSGRRRKQPCLSQLWQRHVLALISEQGAIPMDQLARFLDYQAEEIAELVEQLCVAELAKRGCLLADEPDWVWLTSGGTRLAEMGFKDYLPAPGALARLRAMNEVRLHIAASAPHARWIGWRTLQRELSGGGQIPNAVVEIDGERHAIEVELSRKETEVAAQMIDHRSANYDAVVCFCIPQTRRFYKRLAAENYWPKLVIYPLPARDTEATDSASPPGSSSQWSAVPSTWGWCPDEPAAEVDDALWAELEPLIPKDQRSGAGSKTKRTSDRTVLSGILYVLRYGIGFRALPRELGYGSGVTCLERLRHWERAGIWADVQQLLQAQLSDGDRLDWSRLAPMPSRSRSQPVLPFECKEADAPFRYEVDDALWAELEPLIPRSTTVAGRPGKTMRRVSDRAVLSALLFIMRNAIGWKRLPKGLGYGSWITSYQRVRAWQELEGWDRFVEALVEKLPDGEQLDWARLHPNPARRRGRAR